MMSVTPTRCSLFANVTLSFRRSFFANATASLTPFTARVKASVTSGLKHNITNAVPQKTMDLLLDAP